MQHTEANLGQKVPYASASPTDLSVLRKKQAEAMRILKRARFNAHARLERKSAFSLFTLAMFALYGVGISLYPSLFEDRFNKDTLKVLTFVSIISSIFIIIVTFIEALNDYRVKGLALQKCGMHVTNLLQYFESAEIRNSQDLQWFVREYGAIIDSCPYNHDDVDYQRALASERERKKDKGFGDYAFIYWRIFRYNLNVYWLYLALLLAPVGLFFLPLA
jgi:hypothetical protein